MVNVITCEDDTIELIILKIAPPCNLVFTNQQGKSRVQQCLKQVETELLSTVPRAKQAALVKPVQA